MEANNRTTNRYFEGKEHAQAYAKFRLQFPEEILKRITKYVEEAGRKCDTAIDVGCGTGHQSTVPLARFFNNVIGVDISQEQINQAPKDLPNVTFRVGGAEDLSFLQDASVDLVSVATAIHWLGLELFYKEVERVLKPGGCMAVYWLGWQESLDDLTDQEIKKLRRATYGYRPEAVKKLWDRFELPACPYGQWKYCNDIVMRKQLPVDEFLSLESTMSYNQLYLKDHPDTSLYKDYRERLTAIVRRNNNNLTPEPPMVDFQYTVHLLLCRKP